MHLFIYLYRSVYNYAKADEYLKCGPGIISISDKSVDSNLFSQLQVLTDTADNFIGYWAINDDKLMEQIINFFDQNPTLQSPGRSGGQINTDHKKSIDISILPSSLKDQKFDIFSKYSDILDKIKVPILECNFDDPDYKEKYTNFYNSFLK